MIKCMVLLNMILFFSSCFKRKEKLPIELSAAINKYKSIVKDSLTDIIIKPTSKFYLKLKKNYLIKDSFEIENIGDKTFMIDYLNTSMNNLKILTSVNTVSPKSSKTISFEYEVDNNFIDDDGRLSALLLIVGNAKNNISVLHIGGIFK